MKSVQENNVGPGPATQGHAPAWRDAVRAAAREAALALDKARWDKLGCTAPLFAYRWEHVQAVVRLANRLAELTGADREIVDADKLTWLGATSVLHIVGSAGERGRATTAQTLEDLSDVVWREGIARSLHTAPARTAGRKRVEAFRAFYEQAAREFNGDDLL